MPLKPTAQTLLDALTPFGTDAHLALAVSGGGDSMGLLALAAQLQNTDTAPRFSVLTINHGLRAQAAEEAAQVAAMCKKLGLPHAILAADERLGATDIQQQARNLRYRLMAQWCADNQAQGVVLAHHRDDQAETILMRLARGSGISGLGGMAAKQVLHTAQGSLLLLRPFLASAGVDLQDCAHQAGLPVIDDPSNRDSQYERVRWRQILPLLEAEGLGAERLAAMADEMRMVQAALDNKLANWLDRHADWHDYGVLSVPRNDFDALPVPHKQRFIGRFAQYFGQHAHPLKQKKTDRLLRHIDDTAHGASVLGGMHVRWRKAKLFLGREAAACPTALMVPHTDVVYDRRFKLTASENAENQRLAALGSTGVASMRARGVVFDDTVPTAYFAALPGIFDGDNLLDCPLVPVPDATLKPVKLGGIFHKSLYRDILRGGQS